MARITDFPMKDETPLRRALLGSLPEGTCVCGAPRLLHYSLDGQMIGCANAISRQQPESPLVWGDPYPAVTRDVLWTLMLDSGPAVRELLNTFTHDERVSLARELARRAVSAYLAEVAK